MATSKVKAKDIVLKEDEFAVCYLDEENADGYVYLARTRKGLIRCLQAAGWKGLKDFTRETRYTEEHILNTLFMTWECVGGGVRLDTYELDTEVEVVLVTADRHALDNGI